ncbi:MAG: hypothetical protein K2K41_05940, partial [Ruminiclostridium sp.]|nr:hypothetical protein [Ruminiclostridium sp.]
FLMKTLFTAFLAIICLCMRAPYLFMTQNLLLLEFCIIAIPSFFLSLQPNKERVQGKFITHVLSRSFSGAFVLIICVMAMYITNVIDSAEFGQHYLPMCMIALTFSGLVMVYRVCKPLNAYRAILCLSMLGLCIAAYAVTPIAEMMLYTGWSKLEWDYSKILIIVVVIEAAFPLSNWMIKLMQVIMPSASNSVKPKHNKHTANQPQQTPPPAPPAQPAE